MSRKHNVKHHRSPSRYWARLEARGVTSSSVRMPFFSSDGKRHSTAEGITRRSKPVHTDNNTEAA